MLLYLMDQGISVNYTKAASLNYNRFMPSNSPGLREGGWGWSPLGLCCRYGGETARAEAEFAQGIVPYSIESDTALQLAAQNGNVDAVRVLLDQGRTKIFWIRQGEHRCREHNIMIGQKS